MTYTTFERMEKKYRLTQVQYKMLMDLCNERIQLDEYGLHTISNIYYDTEQDECIRWSIEKPDYKEKLRIRTYNAEVENPEVFVEIKKKSNGIVYKRRIESSMDEAYALCDGDRQKDSSQIRKEIEYFVDFYKPIPRIYLAYDRLAYFGVMEDLRITFDKNIRYRYVDVSLKSSDKDIYLTKEDEILMEVKVLNAMPLWFTRILSELQIYPISFSKYGTIYKQTIMKESDNSQKREKICLPVYSTMQQAV